MTTTSKSGRTGQMMGNVTHGNDGDVSRRVGNIRAVTLDGRHINSDLIYGADQALRNVSEETGGKIPHAQQLEIDRRKYELKTNIINVFGRIRERTI